ncbi:two-component regulator propeller domain-containing protein [Mucilaginibacter sp. cycad4]|uniref:two-component regulator propeller domain-containing protein n=1 Tax=Mucilaginibacter sp. cycad4 TaxID=3342096 RepID=UPI002AAB2E27|nr:two-component regulator propeller domain-containing protein [Mucilaginibacter gossypii]WPV02136.1 two-component regulator propeller domain-containing protein [Mucilaginibacter gossypii]
MKCYKFLIVVVFILCRNIYAFGQPLSYIGIEQGLSNNTVTAIHKDKFGLMWFGTIDGLNRYDGYNFKTFRNSYDNPSSLPNDIITAISSDLAGDVWVGTQKGLGIFDNKSLGFSGIYYQNNLNQKTFFDKWVNDIKTDSKGNMYIASADIGFLICKAGTREAVRIPLLDHNNRIFQYSALAIAFGKKNEIWIITDGGGLCRYNVKANAFVRLTTSMPTATCIKPDSTGDLWIGTKVGVYNYHLSSARLQKFELKDSALNKCRITNILLDKKNLLWIATDGEGIIKLNTHTRQYQTVKQDGIAMLSSDAIYTIYEDELSRKWIGTLRGGIDIIDEKKDQFKTISHEPYNHESVCSNFIFSFCEDSDKNIWIGTDGGGLSVWQRKKNIFQNYVFQNGKAGEISNNHIPSIIKDDAQNIWIATFGEGIIRFNVKTRRFEKIPIQGRTGFNSVWKIFKDQNGKIWASCLRGTKHLNEHNRLYCYNPVKNDFSPAAFIVNTDILSIENNDSENLWLGSFNGLMRVNKNEGINLTIDLKTSVRSLHKSSSGKLWIGTYGRGLICYDDSRNAFIYYTEKNGLCNNKVLNIEEDGKGNIWVSTYNGISKLNPSSGKFENFYAVDGLQSNQFYYNASAKLSSGEFLFGGIKGFNIFHPDSIRQFHDFPPLIITGLRIANASVNIDSDFFPGASSFYDIDHIRLPYDKAIISLDYAALEYSLPEKVQYAYFLKGRDQAWNYVGNQRSINYSHLNEGTYILKLRSTNASGIWNTKERLIYITVIPPWYRTWWAYFLYLGCIITAIYTYILYQHKQTALQYEMKFVKELNEKKIDFFTNISHELRAPLVLIVNPIKDLLVNNGANIDLIDISAVYRNSRRLLSLVDQLLLFKRSENEIASLHQTLLNLKEVCYEVFLCFNNQVKAKKIDYQFICTDQDTRIFADREKLEIILFNLISNAVKYTPDRGIVHVELKKNGQFLEILIKDTGYGIPEETGEKIFEKFYRLQRDSKTQSGFGIGLFLAKKYVDLHQGKLSYTSVLDEGTTFAIQLLSVHTTTFGDFPQQNTELDKDRLNLLQELIVDSPEFEESDVKKEQYVDVIMTDVVNKKPAILLIDDDAEVRRYIKHLLQGEFTVYEAGNTEIGFEHVLEYEPDIIVCDVVLKGTSGVEFCSKMKESPSFSHIPIILLTGSSSPEIKLKGIECGADDYITKPFENELLVARIKSMLKGRNILKNYFFNEVTLKNNNLKVPVEYSEFLAKCIRIIESHLQDPEFSLKTFTNEMGMSRSKLFRRIKSISGLSSTEFVRYIRLKKAAELMIQTDLHIKEIVFKIGFQDIRHFREQFNKLFEMNPSDFIRKYRKTFTDRDNLNANISNLKNKD